MISVFGVKPPREFFALAVPMMLASTIGCIQTYRLFTKSTDVCVNKNKKHTWEHVEDKQSLLSGNAYNQEAVNAHENESHLFPLTFHSRAFRRSNDQWAPSSARKPPLSIF